MILLMLFAATVAANGFSSNNLPQYGGGQRRHHEQKLKEIPIFLSINQNFTVQEGDDVSFPCHVHKTADLKMIFKYIAEDEQDRIIYVGNETVGLTPRILKDGSTFILNNVLKSDAGKYVCRFETSPPVKLIHILDIQYPAKIHRNGPVIQKVIRESTVTIRCESTGNPTPNVSWTRRGNPLRSKSITIQGSSLTLHNVDRSGEGTYVCTASNNIGPPSSDNITIHVEQKPEASTKQTISTRNGIIEAELLCLVHGRPPASVSWLREDSLVSSRRHIMTYDGTHRHTLTISNVTEKDFGNYTCRATNIHGTAKQSIRVSGLPRRPRVISNSVGFDKQSYRVTWETESIAPVEQYRIRYRSAVRNQGIPEKGIPWIDRLYSPSWPEEGSVFPSDGLYVMNHRIEDLEPYEDYEVTVRVENKYGWSEESDSFTFYTKKEILLGQSTSNASSRTSSLHALLWSTSSYFTTTGLLCHFYRNALT